MRKSTLFFHPKVFSKKVQRLTFAISPVFEVDGTLTTLLVSYSACSVKDQFCKATGREVALNRTPVEVSLSNLHKHIHSIIKQYNDWVEPPPPANFAFLTLSFI